MQNPKRYIPKPCDKRLSNMIAFKEGRFCNSCNHQVYDFRQKTESEIKDIIRKEKAVCGIFYEEQLDQSLIYKNTFSYKWSGKWMASFLTFLGLQLSNSGEAATLVRKQNPIYQVQKNTISEYKDPRASIQVNFIYKGLNVNYGLTGTLYINGVMIDRIQIQNGTFMYEFNKELVGTEKISLIIDAGKYKTRRYVYKNKKTTIALPVESVNPPQTYTLEIYRHKRMGSIFHKKRRVIVGKYRME